MISGELLRAQTRIDGCAPIRRDQTRDLLVGVLARGIRAGVEETGRGEPTRD